MIGKELCPHCGAKQFERQPDSSRQSQDVFYECGNSITFMFGSHGEELSQTDHGGCQNKIDWTNILVTYSEDFDKVAKEIDSRFFGWIEYQFYRNYHGIGWKNRFLGRDCVDTEFLDEYFQGKELYLANVVSINNNPIYTNSDSIIVKKDYYDWIGPVTMIQINKKESSEYVTTVYKVIDAEWKESYINGYVVEKIQVGGGDGSRDFYDKEILDIIFDDIK